MLIDNVNPIRLYGNWDKGWALDYHTIYSKFYTGNNKYITERTPIGESLYNLKYNHDWRQAWPIGRAVYDFLNVNSYQINFDYLLTIPPSRFRLFYQPVKLLGWRTSRLVQIPYLKNKIKAKSRFREMKDIKSYDERLIMMADSFYLKPIPQLANILLLDDVYRSGATLNEAARVLWEYGSIKYLYVITITKTRVNK